MSLFASFLDHLLQHLVPAVAGVVAAWLSARWPEKAPPFDPGVGGQVLRYGWTFRALSLVCFALLGGPSLLVADSFVVGVVCDPTRLREPAGVLVAVPVLIFALAAYLVLEAFRVRIAVTPAGVISSSPWRRRRAIRWVDVTAVSYSDLFDWLTITGRHGEKIRAHRYLQGLPWLARALQRCAPPEAYVRGGGVVEALARRAGAKP
jgi:hypothetical protein